MATAKAKQKTAVGRELEYKPDIFNEQKFTEQDYQQKMNNREALKLEITDFDMRPFEAELYTQQLVQFMDLQELVLEHCNLENFFPKGLGKLKKLSLKGNQVPNFSQIILTSESEERARGNPNNFGRQFVPDTELTHLNLSDNSFEAFPYVAIYLMGENCLKKVDLSRNRLTTLLDDNERKVFRNSIRQQLKGIEPFAVFKKLVSLDLSSN